MKILALDQASRVSGWAIFNDDSLEKYGKIDVSSQYELGDRLHTIRKKVRNLIESNDIDMVILEDIYMDN